MARSGLRRGAWIETAAAALALALAVGAALGVVRARGWTLDYGDAEAHLNIARRIVDSRTPGYDQIGTVWLPLPHLLMLPLVSRDAWWRDGAAGAIPAAVCFWLGGMFLFSAARRAGGRAVAWTALAVLGLNPNLLYLSATPMTEAASVAALAGLLWCTVRFRGQPGAAWAAACGAANLLATLTRYEGWFVIPFVALYLLVNGGRRRWLYALLFCAIASLGPLWWLAHNYYYFDNPLDFFNGPYSAKAIYRRALDAGMARYPGDGDWAAALRYFAAAIQACLGWPAVVLGAAGLAAGIVRRCRWPLAFLALAPAFYVASMHSGGTPIFLPTLWPFSFYNSRYALAALPLLAFAAGTLTLAARERFRPYAAAAIVAAALAPWWIHPRPEAWIVWKEGQVNGAGRRAWTREAAAYLGPRYRMGDGVIAPFGDLTGIFREAGIPLRETLHEGNGVAFDAAIANPRVYLREGWAVAISGDRVATAILRCRRTGPRYDRVMVIAEPHSPVIEIYRRD